MLDNKDQREIVASLVQMVSLEVKDPKETKVLQEVLAVLVNQDHRVLLERLEI